MTAAAMRIGKASGTQVAFFTFAGLLLVVPLSQWIVRAHDWAPELEAFVARFLPVMAMGAVLLLVAPLRRWCQAQLAIAVPEGRRREAWLVSLSGPAVAFAVAGSLVLWHWTAGGPAELERWVRGWPVPERQMAQALTATGIATLLVSAVAGPVVEELVFRGMLYRVWEARWGWLLATLLSSLVFGAYHGGFWHAFANGILYCVLYRRTGSLLAPILAHGIYNASLWYPFLGRFVFPGDLDDPGELGSWSVHLACVLAAAVAMPVYLVMARDRAALLPSAPR